MGRRPGHRFHPSENRATGAMLFGHGPIFRDHNAVLDTQAVSPATGAADGLYCDVVRVQFDQLFP